MLPGNFQVVNNGPGDQTDPHVDCDLVSYTDDDFSGVLRIRYFDVATSTDHAIPGNGADSLSDASGTRIAFTEATLDGPQVVVFETSTQQRTVIPGTHKNRPTLGGNLMAFQDGNFYAESAQSEISVYDLNTGTGTRLTNDTLVDKLVAVSPTGNAMVWEKSQEDGSGGDIYAAIQTSPGVFSVTALTGAAGKEHNPDTNGEVVVYTSTRAGETDIFFTAHRRRPRNAARPSRRTARSKHLG